MPAGNQSTEIEFVRVSLIIRSQWGRQTVEGFCECFYSPAHCVISFCCLLSLLIFLTSLVCNQLFFVPSLLSLQRRMSSPKEALNAQESLWEPESTPSYCAHKNNQRPRIPWRNQPPPFQTGLLSDTGQNITALHSPLQLKKKKRLPSFGTSFHHIGIQQHPASFEVM